MCPSDKDTTRNRTFKTQTHAGFNKYLKELFRRAETKESKGVVRLVSKPEFNYVFMKSEEALASGLEHPKVLKLVELVTLEKEKNERRKNNCLYSI